MGGNILDGEENDAARYRREYPSIEGMKAFVAGGFKAIV